MKCLEKSENEKQIGHMNSIHWICRYINQKNDMGFNGTLVELLRGMCAMTGHSIRHKPY